VPQLLKKVEMSTQLPRRTVPAQPPLKSECKSTPLAKNDPRYARALALRARLALAAFTTGVPPVYSEPPAAEETVYLPPTDAYTTTFLALADSGVVALVQQIFADERKAIEEGRRLPVDARRPPVVRKQQPDEPGYVYCFRNVLDRPDLLKIGRTRRTARQRGAEWEHDLEPQEGQQITVLFAVPTRYNKFAERVVHATLLCEHQGKRVNERTGRLLTEYYNLKNFSEVKLFVMLCVGYVNWWGDTMRREFETTSPIYEEWLNVTQNK
jgi:hypothetical protein